MYLTPNENYWAIDIEGDGLPSNKIWCMTACNYVTGEEIKLADTGNIRRWIEERKRGGAKFIGHNIIGYDAPTLNRLLGCRLVISDLIDTLLLSMHYSPSLRGGHSLANWGERLRYPKGDFNDFSKYTPEMLSYCMQDTRLCLRVYKCLVGRMTNVGFTDLGIELEHRSWQLIKKQQEIGFKFNIQGAHVLLAQLRQIENELRDELYVFWPPSLQRVATFKKSRKANGDYSANYLRHVTEYERVDVLPSGDYDCFGHVSFSIGSPVQRVEKLLELGWEPKEFTPTGNPKPTDKGKLTPSLVSFVESSGRTEPRLIAQWIEINSRANTINTWIEAYNDKTGCIHGSLWLANTLRYRHSNPNTANIPAVRLRKDSEGIEHPLYGRDGSFTYESRDLWVCRDSANRSLVGVDAKGIQLRVLAHYLNNKDFIDAVLGGDPHSYNQQIGGFGSRAVAKTFIYAFLLGAGDEKVGQIIGGSTRDGKDIKARFIGNFPGLANLLDDLERQINRTGRIKLCDGSPLIVTAPHTRLGYLLQGDESRIMRKSLILTEREIRRRKLDVLKVGDIHDEWQNDVLNRDIEEFEAGCKETFAASGVFFNYNLPIDCDSKVGKTWAETH